MSHILAAMSHLNKQIITIVVSAMNSLEHYESIRCGDLTYPRGTNFHIGIGRKKNLLPEKLEKQKNSKCEGPGAERATRSGETAGSALWLDSASERQRSPKYVW